MPVNAAPIGNAQRLASQLDDQLAQGLSPIFEDRLINAERMSHWLHVMQMSQFDRPELQVGQITGADLLVIPRLAHHGDSYLLELKLIDTATGRIGWHKIADYQPGQAIDELIARLGEEIDLHAKEIPAQPIDIALLKPIDAQDQRRWRNQRPAKKCQQWADQLSRIDPRIRVIDPGLSAFVKHQDTAERFGFVDPERAERVVRDAIVVTGRIDLPPDDAQAPPQERYQIRFIVKDGAWMKTVYASGTLAESAEVQAEALNRLLAVVAERREIEINEQVQPQAQQIEQQVERRGEPALVTDPLLLRLAGDGGGPESLDAAIASAWSSRALTGWTPIMRVVTQAIDKDDMPLAFKAYRAQLTLFPNYHGERYLKHNGRADRLKEDECLSRPWSRWTGDLFKPDTPHWLNLGHDIEAVRQFIHVAEPKRFQRLAAEKRWQQIYDEARDALRVRAPDRNGLLLWWRPTQAYIYSLNNLLEDQALEQRLLQMVSGDLPKVRGGWDRNVVMRHRGWAMRLEAAQVLTHRWAEQRRFDDIMQHPLIGPRAWYHSNVGDQWDLYLYTDEPWHAIDFAQTDTDKACAYLYAGRFEEALGVKLDADDWNHSFHMKAGIMAGDWGAFDQAANRIAEKSDYKEDQIFIEQVRLMRRFPEACDAWVKGYTAEFLKQPDQALEAYQRCANIYPTTFPGAESMFRVGELKWLGRQSQRDVAQVWFDQAKGAYLEIVRRSDDQRLKAWAYFRIGQIALLTQDNPDAARKAWEVGRKQAGVGKRLCEWSLHSLDDAEPTVRVGKDEHAIAKRIVDIDLDSGNLQVLLDRGHLATQIDSHVFGPIGLDMSLFDAWSDDQVSDWWSVYLWYLFNDIRPGLTMVYVSTPVETELIWCRIREPGRDAE